MIDFATVDARLRDATGRAFPAAQLIAVDHFSLVFERATGACEPETLFDVASLTKPLSTATLAMMAIEEGALALDDRPRPDVTVAELLTHSSGLPAWKLLGSSRAEVLRAVAAEPLVAAPGTIARYSDLGFILLGFILEDAQPRTAAYVGASGALDPARRLRAQFEWLARSVTVEPLAFNPPRAWRDRTAPTELDPWRGRLLVGEVHDENAWALGGAAGHAGLFGTVGAVGDFARAVLATIGGAPALARPETMRRFMARGTVPGSSRALGWDTMLPTSSCGRTLSPSAIGHTGFTGTSLWIDHERDLYIVLLTNRIHPSRANEQLRALRPRVHEAVVSAFDRHFR